MTTESGVHEDTTDAKSFMKLFGKFLSRTGIAKQKGFTDIQNIEDEEIEEVS